MFGFFKKLFKKTPKPRFSDEDCEKHYDEKKVAMEKILGPMHNLVGHALIPFCIGGSVDMYYFPMAVSGTCFATMELIEPDGTGPKPGAIGTYELVAFTKLPFSDSDVMLKDEPSQYNKIERRICSIFTQTGHYSYEAVLNPMETIELPDRDDATNSNCLILDEYKIDGAEFEIFGRKHGLLLIIEVFREELEFAMNNGTGKLLKKLKEKGYYPYSDLDRAPVV